MYLNGRSLFLNVVEHFLARPADVAYVYSSDIGGARSYRSLLNSNGIPTALISMHIVHLVNFSKYKVIIVGADTGNLNSWGNPAAIEAIKNSPRPVIGNGEGGYAFFGKLNLSIGYPHGWHGSNTSIFAVDLLHSVFNYPNDIPIPKSRVLDLYLRTGHVGIYLPIVSVMVDIKSGWKHLMIQVVRVVFDKADLFNALNVTKTDGLITILPETSALLPNYPNPFNPETWIPYQLANDTNVKINIYNVKGQIIRILSLGQKQAGTYFVKDKAAYWDAKDELGQKVASGIYYYTLHTEEFRATRKMVILK